MNEGYAFLLGVLRGLELALLPQTVGRPSSPRAAGRTGHRRKTRTSSGSRTSASSAPTVTSESPAKTAPSTAAAPSAPKVKPKKGTETYAGRGECAGCRTKGRVYQVGAEQLCAECLEAEREG